MGLSWKGASGAVAFAATLATCGAFGAGPSLASWSRPLALSVPGNDTLFPTVASDGTGDVVVAWYRRLGNRSHLVARTSSNGGRTWGPPQPLGPALIAQDGNRPALVRAAVGADGLGPSG